MPGLLIGEDERQRIAEVRAFAAANVMDPFGSITAAARDMQAYRDMMAMLTIELPIGYHITYSHEQQPDGLCRHISVSVARAGRMPSTEAVEMILGAFGMTPIRTSVALWIEDIDADTKAINLVQPLA